MLCRDVKHFVTRRLPWECTTAERSAVNNHLRGCRSCQDYQLRIVNFKLRDTSDEDVVRYVALAALLKLSLDSRDKADPEYVQQVGRQQRRETIHL